MWYWPEMYTKACRKQVSEKSDYIVSGDRHLLGLQEYQGIRILTPRAFLTFLGEQLPP